MAGHKLLTWEECHKTHIDSSSSCPICDGGLAYCTVCKGAEAGLPTDCPGRPMTQEEDDAIMAGKLDFVNGQWVAQSNIPTGGVLTMKLSEQFRNVIGPEAVQYVYDRLTAVVGDFITADQAIETAYANRAELAARKVELDTEIKLDESDALMAIQGEGKTAYIILNGQQTFLTNDTARDAYRRTVTKVKREELGKVESQLARIDIEIARAKDKYRTAADAADSLKATAAVQAALLTTIGKAYDPGLAVKP